MIKTTMTPKELSKSRLAKSKLMKLPKNEGNFYNKENESPQLINASKNKFKIHDREIKHLNLPNPFNLPDHKRMFSKSIDQRKVKPEPFIMSEPHTICDIDDTFYKIIEGRPLRQFSDVKVYMQNIRDITLLKANAAYLNDQVIQLDTKFTYEDEQYNQILKIYEKTQRNFIRFIKESYEKAKTKQIIAEMKSSEVAKAREQLEALSFECVKLNNQLSNLFFSFETLLMYEKFLYSLSPDWWRAKYYSNDTKYSMNAAEPKVTLLSYEDTDNTDFKVIISKVKDMHAHLFFNKPEQIMYIYDDLSRLCLNYMHLEVFSGNIRSSVDKCRETLKTDFKAEIDEMKEFIVKYESNVKYLEEKEMAYKVVFEKMLFSEFQQLYASHDTTKLFTCIQYVNTRIFAGPEDPKDNILVLMRQLEMLYNNLSSALDSLNLEVVKKATTELFSDDIKTMKQAHFAQRTLKECDILSKALYTSFEPPRSRRTPKTSKKSKIL